MHADDREFDFSYSSFEEVLLDLAILKDCIDLLDRHLPQLLDAEKRRVRKDWADHEGNVTELLERELDQGVTTRFLTGSLLIAIWAAYEAGVLKYANYIRESKKLTLKLDDLKGGFLERSRKYFEQVLFFDLHPTTTDWGRLRATSKVRHAFAHTNGRLDDLHDDKELRQLAATSSGHLTIVDDEYLVASTAFAQSSWSFINDLLTDLHHRVKRTY